MAYVYVQHAQCVLLFLVLVVNSDRFYIVTHSYSSRPFLCTLVIPGAYERREAALIVVHKLLVTLIYVTIFPAYAEFDGALTYIWVFSWTCTWGRSATGKRGEKYME